VIKAGTVIFVACGVVWFLQSFNWGLQMVDPGQSILASIGTVIAPIFVPLGFGTWQATVATITGLVAKENVVGTFGVLYGLSEVAGDGVEIWSRVAADFTVVSAFAFLVFNMLCAPCFAAIGTIKREMGSWKWTWITIGYQTTLAYAVAFIVNQIGSVVFLGQNFTILTVVALAIIAFVIWLLVRPAKKLIPVVVIQQ